MRKFKFKYSTLVVILLFVVIILSLLGLFFNLYNVIAYVNLNNGKMISSLLLSLITLFATVFAISILFCGRYYVNGNNLILQFGFIKSKVNLNEAIEIIYYKKSKSLVLYYQENKYTVIVIDEKEYEDFIVEIREVNPKIIYDRKIDGEDTPN